MSPLSPIEMSLGHAVVETFGGRGEADPLAKQSAEMTL